MRIALLLAVLAMLVASCGADSDVSRLLGARCEDVAECDDRCLAAPARDYPDGFCSLDCDANDDCPSGSDCINRDGGVCLFTCELDVDCGFLGVDWICRNQGLRENPSIRSGVCLGN